MWPVLGAYPGSCLWSILLAEPWELHLPASKAVPWGRAEHHKFLKSYNGFMRLAVTSILFFPSAFFNHSFADLNISFMISWFYGNSV